MNHVASNAPYFRETADFTMFEKIAAENYQRPTGTKMKHRFPLSAGATVKKRISDRFSLESGLVYTFLSSELTAGEGDYYKQEQRLHYLGNTCESELYHPGRKTVYLSMLLREQWRRCVWTEV